MDKKSKNTLIISIIALALVIIGVTYAYFSARITGLESASTISLTAGHMGIHYTEGDEEVTFNNIYPREEAWVTKTFTLTGYNTTDMPMKYDIGLNVITNTFTDEYLTYDLRLVSSTNGTPIATTTNNPISGTGKIKFGTGTFTNADGDTHNYELKIYFKDNGEDQNDSQNAIFNAKIYVEEYNPNAIVSLSRPVYSIDQEACEDYLENDTDFSSAYTPSQITTLCSGEPVCYENICYQFGIGLRIDDILIQEGLMTQTGIDTSSNPVSGDRHRENQYVYKYNHVLVPSNPNNRLPYQSSLINSSSNNYKPRLLALGPTVNLLYSWAMVTDEGWGVSVANKESYSPITEAVLKSINSKPITNASYMFARSQASSIDLSSFDTSSIIRMDGMFSDIYYATSLDLSSFNTSNVIDMSFMFGSIYTLSSIDVSSFDTSNVTDMSEMFAYNSADIIGLTNFDTSNVTDMFRMFLDCESDTLDLTSFDFSSVNDIEEFAGTASGGNPISIYAKNSDDASLICTNSYTNVTVYVNNEASCTGELGQWSSE